MPADEQNDPIDVTRRFALTRQNQIGKDAMALGPRSQ